MTARNDLSYRAAMLMSDIRYQIFVPETPTIGACQSCSALARGSRTCERCLTRELALIVGTRIANNYLAAATTLREAELAVLHTAKTGQA